MGKILAQLERMASSEYYRDTPSTVTVNPMMDAGYEASGVVAPYQDPMAGMSAEEVRMYGEADGITTDLGEAHDITITGGSESGYKKDVGSFLNNLATGGLVKVRGQCQLSLSRVVFLLCREYRRVGQAIVPLSLPTASQMS